MAWSDTDDGGYGEFGGGYEGSPAGGGWQDNALSLAMAAYDKDLDYDTLAAYFDGPYAQNHLDQYGFSKGHHPGLTVTGRYGAPTDENPGGYLAALQAELAHINQNVRNNNTIDAIAAHNQNIIGQRMSNQGPRRGSRPNTGWVQSTQPFDAFNPPTVDIRDMTNVMNQLGGGMPGSGAMSGSFGYGNSDGGLLSDGGGEYYIRKPHRLAYKNAYNMWEGGDAA
jgi:hypothetical protein